MAACMKEVDAERLLRQTSSPPTARLVQTPSSAPIDRGGWRVVSADGSLSRLTPAPAAREESPPPVAAAAASSRKNLAMPVGVPKLSQILPPDGRPSLPTGLVSSRAAVTLEPAVVESIRRPAEPPIPLQAAGGCRDIDLQLARVIEVWTRLPENIRAAAMAMIDTVADEG